MVRPSLEYLDGSERRERHGVRPRREDSRASAESREGLLADPRGGATCGSGAQGPEGAAPAVLRSGLVVPPAIVAEAVTEPSVCPLRWSEEGHVTAAHRHTVPLRLRAPRLRHP